MQQPQHPHPPPLSILLPFGVALGAVVALRIFGHPEGITDVYTLLTTLYMVMGWRNAMPVPHGGGAMLLDRAAVASMVSSRSPVPTLGELPLRAQLARQVLDILRLRNIEVPEPVRTRLLDAEEEVLWRAIAAAPKAQRAEEVLASGKTKPYPLQAGMLVGLLASASLWQMDAARTAGRDAWWAVPSRKYDNRGHKGDAGEL